MRQEVRDDEGEVIQRKAGRAAHSADDRPLLLRGFPGQLVQRLLWSWRPCAPRLRHLRMVSVLTPKRLASTPVGSAEQAISLRTAGVVRAWR
jgi:hypothetical protein